MGGNALRYASGDRRNRLRIRPSSTRAAVGCGCYGCRARQLFSFRIEDERKIDGSVSLIAEGDQRYFGFLLYCDLASGKVTVDAPNTNLTKSTREASNLCKEFASKYAEATSGRFV
jgi:hypothetical protein